MNAGLSVIIPTIGRPTLLRSLYSVALQAHPGDEILVIGDGPQPEARVITTEVSAAFPKLHISCIYDGPTHNWGHRQRQTGMQMAEGDYIAFLDDDDIWGQHARRYIHYHTSCYPGQPLMFRMVAPEGHVLWRDPELRQGNVGTPMVVVPNIKSKLGTWGDRYEGDYDFMASLKWAPAEFVWLTGIVCICRPPEGHSWVDSGEFIKP